MGIINYFSIIYLISAGIGATLIYYLNKKRKYSLSIYWFLGIAITGIFNSLANLVIMNTRDAQIFLISQSVSYATILLLSPVFLTFALAYAQHEEIIKKILYFPIIFIPFLFFLYLCWSTNLIFVNDFNKAILTPWGYTPQNGEMNFWMSIYQLVYSSFIFMVLTEFALRLKEISKIWRALLIMLASFIPIIGSILFYTLISPLFQLPYIPINGILISITVVIAGIALKKYGAGVFSEEAAAISIFKTMSEAVIAFNKNYLIEFVNLGTENIFEYLENELKGKSIDILFTRDNNYIISDILKQLNEKSVITYNDINLVKKTGGFISVNISVSILFDLDNKPTGYILVANDISQMKESLRRLKEENASLIIHQRQLEEIQLNLTHNNSASN